VVIKGWAHLKFLHLNSFQRYFFLNLIPRGDKKIHCTGNSYQINAVLENRNQNPKRLFTS
jgi:hypothetical protein